MPAVALSRVGARVVESGPGGEDLPASAWQRLQGLPDPRSPRGRIYPLACLVAIAVCAFTAAGNDRFTAIGQWVKRASQADLARLRAPWDPPGGRYRAPDEKTVRVVLDRLDPRALARALLGSGPGRRSGGPPPASVRGYRARRAAGQAKMLARDRLRAVAVDGRTARGARRADGTRVHLPGVAGHGGRLLDHLEVGDGHNETSHLTGLLEPLDLQGAVVTAGALHTVRANLDWLVTDKKAHYIAIVEHASHCSCCLSWRVKQSSLAASDLDTQAFAASLGEVDGVELAALDLVQHGLAGDAEVAGGLAEGQPAVGCLGPDAVAELLVDADLPGCSGGELLAGDEAVAQPPVDGGAGDAELAGGFADADHGCILAAGCDIFGRRVVAGDAVVGA
jgi:hypothetical protein